MDVPLDDLGTPRRDQIHPAYEFPSVLTSRGCPYACSFCYLTVYRRRKYRVVPVDTVLEDLDAVLDAHEAGGNGRFRGIRHAGSHALHPEVLTIPGRAPAGLYADAAFRSGLARLGERGLTYDTWHFHYQNRDFLELARAMPGTTMTSGTLINSSYAMPF